MQMLYLVTIVERTLDNPSRHPYASIRIGAYTLNKPKFSLQWKTRMCFKKTWECSSKSQGGGGAFSISHHTIIIATTKRNNNNIINFYNVLKMIVDYKKLVSELFVHRGGFVFRSFLESFKYLGMRMFISSWKPCQSLCGLENFVKAKLLCNVLNTLKS